MKEPIRLSKRVIELFGCSRREADAYIEGGWISVNGKVIEAPQHKVTDETIERHPEASIESAQVVSLLLNAPARANHDQLIQNLTPDTHWSEDPHSMRILYGHFKRQEQSLPLQYGASGLVVLSQDWRAQRKLREDGAKLEQEYVLEVSGELSDSIFERLKKGLLHKGRSFAPCKASWQSEQRLRLVVKNPADNFIVDLCRALNLELKSFKRIRIGGVPMSKLPAGQWRYLGAKERF